MSELTYTSANPEDTGRFGARLAPLLTAGDLVILDGRLGAGKTTLVRAIGQALQARGTITSPTFVIAREHPTATVPLVHVDAYRLESAAELDALDLDATADEVITIVEWGKDKVETLSDSHLLIRIDRPVGDADEDDTRTLTVSAHGRAWAGRDLSALTGGQAV